jgi:hypothetical protein
VVDPVFDVCVGDGAVGAPEFARGQLGEEALDEADLAGAGEREVELEAG